MDFGSKDIFFVPFSLFVSVYVYVSVCDFVCITLLSPFVLGFSPSIFFFTFKIFFLVVIFYFNNFFILFYFILFYLLSFFLSSYFCSLLF